MGEAPGLRPSRSGPCQEAVVRVNDEWCENGVQGLPRCGECAGCKLKIRRYVAEMKALSDRSEPESHPE
jgi:hypothetical protein